MERQLASCGEDHLVRLWRAEDGCCSKRSLGHTNSVAGVALESRWAASGQLRRRRHGWGAFALGCRQRRAVALLRRTYKRGISGRLESRWKRFAQRRYRWRALLVGCGKQKQSLDTAEPPGWIHSLSVSPDGATLASGRDDGIIQLWDMQHAAPIGTLRIDRPYERMDIAGVAGITEAQRAALRALGAVDGA